MANRDDTHVRHTFKLNSPISNAFEDVLFLLQICLVFLDLRTFSFDSRRALFDCALSCGLGLFILCRQPVNVRNGIKRTHFLEGLFQPLLAVGVLAPFLQPNGLLLLGSSVFGYFFSGAFKFNGPKYTTTGRVKIWLIDKNNEPHMPFHVPLNVFPAFPDG